LDSGGQLDLDDYSRAELACMDFDNLVVNIMRSDGGKFLVSVS
jgi:hypothetical protein